VADSVAERWAALGLSLDPKRNPYANTYNAFLILRNDPVWKNRVWFCEFHQKIRCASAPGARNLRDADEIDFLMFCQSIMQIPKLTIEPVRQAFVRHADGARRDEAIEFFRAQKWDGTSRLREVMKAGFGTEASDYCEVVGEAAIKSIAARATRPGCKQDSVVVLIGGQGEFKSTAVAAIGGEYTGTLHSAVGEKDAYLEIAGKLVVELPELAALRGDETTKKFLSKAVDVFRPPYGRFPVEVARRCCFWGTTNEDTPLRDPTGGRRFLPIKCGRIDIDWLQKNRLQLFAEALVRIDNGEEWWLVDDGDAREEQAARYQDDPWSEPVREFLAGKESVRVAALLKEAVKLETGRQTKKEEMRAAAILKRLGWFSKLAGPAHGRVRTWFHPDVEGGSSGTTVVHLKPKAKQDTEQREQHEQPTYKKNDE